MSIHENFCSFVIEAIFDFLIERLCRISYNSRFLWTKLTDEPRGVSSKRTKSFKKKMQRNLSYPPSSSTKMVASWLKPLFDFLMKGFCRALTTFEFSLLILQTNLECQSVENWVHRKIQRNPTSPWAFTKIFVASWLKPFFDFADERSCRALTTLEFYALSFSTNPEVWVLRGRSPLKKNATKSLLSGIIWLVFVMKFGCGSKQQNFSFWNMSIVRFGTSFMQIWKAVS